MWQIFQEIKSKSKTTPSRRRRAGRTEECGAPDKTTENRIKGWDWAAGWVVEDWVAGLAESLVRAAAGAVAVEFAGD
jgi:hypothetical protein